MRKWLIFGLLIMSVVACKKKKKASTGDGTDNGTTTSTIPGKPNLKAPAQNSICVTGIVVSEKESQVLFTWTNTDNTNSYDLVLKNLLTNTSTTINTTDTQSWATLLRDTPYSWYVSAKQNTSTTTTQSDVWKFYNAGAGVVSYAPFPAEIVSPVYGEIVTPVNGKINLNWKGASVDNNIVAYNVCFGTTTDPPVYKNGVSDTSLNDIPVSANTVYYWRIITVDANNNYTDSGLYQFKTQ